MNSDSAETVLLVTIHSSDLTQLASYLKLDSAHLIVIAPPNTLECDGAVRYVELGSSLLGILSSMPRRSYFAFIESRMLKLFCTSVQEIIDELYAVDSAFVLLMMGARMDVAPTGAASACKFFSEFAVGNLNDATVPEIWNSSTYDKIRTVFERRLSPACSKCNVLYLQEHSMPINI